MHSLRSSTAIRLWLWTFMALLAGCAPAAPAGDPIADQLNALPLRARVAQLVFAPVGPDSAAVARARQWVEEDSIGGVIVRQGDAAGMAHLLADLRARAPLPLLAAAEMDQGAGGVLRGATELPPVRVAAAFAAPALLHAAGYRAGLEARAVGVDLGIVRGPATNEDEPLPPHSWRPARSRAGAVAWLQGIAESGLLTGVELFWVEDPDTAIPLLRWDRARLSAFELPLLRAAAEAGTDVFLPGPVRVPALTGDTLPLPFSATTLEGLLRRDLGRRGAVAVDVSEGSPLARRYGGVEAAVRAFAAGADLLLGVADPPAAVEAITAAVEAGEIPRARVAAAAARVLALKQRAPRGTTVSPDSLGRHLRSPEAVRVAQQVGREVRQMRRVAEGGATAPVLRVTEPEDVGMSADELREVDAVIRSAIEDSVFPGAALAVGRRGGLVRLRGYGRLADTSTAPTVDAVETIYDLASLTKVVGTTSAVMSLVEAGRMELDAPVQSYLPEWRRSAGDRDGDGERITIRHLLTHTAGLPPGLWLFGSASSPEEALEQALDAPLRRPPGEEVDYSDLGMILLKAAAERAAGMPLEEYVAREVFAPLGMSSSLYLPPLALRESIAPSTETSERPFPLQGVVHDGNAFRLGGVAGHAGLFATARDLAVYAQMLLNRGAYGDVRVFRPQTVIEFTKRQPGAEQRALGFDTPSDRSSAGDYFSAASYGHTGYTGTSLWIDPARDLFVVLLTNRTYTDASAREIFEVRQAVHDAVAEAITDVPIQKRPGAR